MFILYIINCIGVLLSLEIGTRHWFKRLRFSYLLFNNTGQFKGLREDADL